MFYNISKKSKMLKKGFCRSDSCTLKKKGLNLRHLIYDFAIYEISRGW